MLSFQRLPWISLLLLLTSYGTLGWVLSETRMSWSVWVVVVIGVLVLLASLAAPFLVMARYSTVFFESSIRTLLVAIFGAFLFFLMVAWFRLFLDSLLIIAAAVLAKIDFHTSGFKEGPAFFLTSLFSFAGIAGGAAVYRLLAGYTPMW